jgi:hypothetical protein
LLVIHLQVAHADCESNSRAASNCNQFKLAIPPFHLDLWQISKRSSKNRTIDCITGVTVSHAAACGIRANGPLPKQINTGFVNFRHKSLAKTTETTAPVFR